MLKNASVRLDIECFELYLRTEASADVRRQALDLGSDLEGEKAVISLSTYGAMGVVGSVRHGLTARRLPLTLRLWRSQRKSFDAGWQRCRTVLPTLTLNSESIATVRLLIMNVSGDRREAVQSRSGDRVRQDGRRQEGRPTASHGVVGGVVRRDAGAAHTNASTHAVADARSSASARVRQRPRRRIRHPTPTTLSSSASPVTTSIEPWRRFVPCLVAAVRRGARRKSTTRTATAPPARSAVRSASPATATRWRATATRRRAPPLRRRSGGSSSGGSRPPGRAGRQPLGRHGSTTITATSTPAG